MSGPLAVLVGSRDIDPLLDPLLAVAGRRGYATRLLRPDELSLVPVAVREDEALIDGLPLSLAVFRAPPSTCFAGAFVPDDVWFASAETRAVWLHVLSVPSVFAVNRGDCATWFASPEWPVWRERFMDAGVPMVPLSVGDPPAESSRCRWLQWNGGLGSLPGPASARCFAAALVEPTPLFQCLWCAGAIVDGPEPAEAETITRVLGNYGVRLAGLVLDGDGRVWTTTTVPWVPVSLADRIATRLLDSIDEDHSGR